MGKRGGTGSTGGRVRRRAVRTASAAQRAWRPLFTTEPPMPPPRPAMRGRSSPLRPPIRATGGKEDCFLEAECLRRPCSRRHHRTGRASHVLPKPAWLKGALECGLGWRRRKKKTPRKPGILYAFNSPVPLKVRTDLSQRLESGADVRRDPLPLGDRVTVPWASWHPLLGKLVELIASDLVLQGTAADTERLRRLLSVRGDFEQGLADEFSFHLGQ
jgi:hypothetical protein